MNKTVCVITGGGSGMGLAAAKEMPKDLIGQEAIFPPFCVTIN